jgi:DNA adenine methylase
MPDLRSPFPWFGGKSRVSELVWDRFGDVSNYVEPFFGSGAVLLGRPHDAHTETVNDLDCMVANFWRSLQNDPDAVADAADRPVNECDQHAIHLWLVTREEFRERMKTDIDYYVPLIAGRWVWGQCTWIGSGWCSVQLPHLGNAGRGVNRQLPHLGNAGTGVHRKLPHLGDAEVKVSRQLPHLGGQGNNGPDGNGASQGVNRETNIRGYMGDLAKRLRRVRVACGDWERVCGPWLHLSTELREFSSIILMPIPQSGRTISMLRIAMKLLIG